MNLNWVIVKQLGLQISKFFALILLCTEYKLVDLDGVAEMKRDNQSDQVSPKLYYLYIYILKKCPQI